MDDIIEAILESLFEGVMESRRVSRIIKCIIWGLLGAALTVLCIWVGGVVGWALAALMVLMTVVLIHKTYRGR